MLSNVIARRSESENSASRNVTAVQPHKLTCLVILCWLMTVPDTVVKKRNISSLLKRTEGMNNTSRYDGNLLCNDSCDLSKNLVNSFHWNFNITHSCIFFIKSKPVRIRSANITLNKVFCKLFCLRRFLEGRQLIKAREQLISPQKYLRCHEL